MIETMLVYAMLTSAMFYLGSRATLTHALWSRYPPKLASFMDCAACSGGWYGLIVGLCGKYTTLIVGPVPHPLVAMFCSIVWTPIVAGLMQHGFERLGSAVEGEPTDG